MNIAVPQRSLLGIKRPFADPSAAQHLRKNPRTGPELTMGDRLPESCRQSSYPASSPCRRQATHFDLIELPDQGARLHPSEQMLLLRRDNYASMTGSSQVQLPGT